jgi:hypothetical protein
MGLYKSYTGKEVCQSCKKSGQQIKRSTKDDLCDDCKDLIKIAKCVDFEKSIKYVTVIDWINGFNTIDYSDKILDSLANNLLESLHNKFSKTDEEIRFGRAQYHGQTRYNIPKNVAIPLKDFFLALNDKIKEIRSIKENLEKDAINAVSIEKNKIYNEGICKGKELLIQLNNGGILLSDFDKEVCYKG